MQMTNITKTWLMQNYYPACKELQLLAGKGLLSRHTYKVLHQLLLERSYACVGTLKGSRFNGKNWSTVAQW